ncbi:MAG: Dihydroorotate dehydrogenase electron transfer subunit [Candidatus Carbobacillus altaicus]|uniref:Dihydroorotate dehydrogenase electron transfer subunit n=1 Tax=Candidatus Carbonibacillus altaicus TaxID=2163959 RepID=A0A2R6Y361_9BACL|nr:MAG: Dihydroorotate dehydrogenase electron transfer subunit [Candidatus Carbobacillus altaicus]
MLEKRLYHEQLFALTLTYPPSMDAIMDALQPGAFVHILPSPSESRQLFLRRPLSIAGLDREKRTVLLIVRVVGQGTEQLREVQPGTVLDVYVPYTHGFPIHNVKNGARALLVGGGVGVAPLLWLAETLHAQGARVTALIGFRESRDVFGLRTFEQWGDVHLVTEDGLSGKPGRVTEYVRDFSYDVLLSCGPEPMLKALAHITAGDSRPHYASLEARMACASGVCRACVVAVRSDVHADTGHHMVSTDDAARIQHRRVCHDGPVFSLSELVWRAP